MHELLRLAFQQPANRNTSPLAHQDRKSTRLNSSHSQISYAVFCLKKKNHMAHNPRFPFSLHKPIAIYIICCYDSLSSSEAIRSNTPTRSHTSSAIPADQCLLGARL